MADACCCQLLKVTLDHKSAPVSQHPVLIDHRVQKLSIGPLIHHLVLEVSNIDCLKEHRGDPGLKQEPASKIDSSDYSISTTLNIVFVPSVLVKRLGLGLGLGLGIENRESKQSQC